MTPTNRVHGFLIPLLFGVSLQASAQQHQRVRDPNEGGLIPPGRLVNLTHPFDRSTIYWPTEDGFRLKVEKSGVTELGYFYSANRFAAAEHGGTHVDTASIDHGQSRRFQAHVTLFRHNIPAFENVANLQSLPTEGSTVIALPMKIGAGTGAPLRIIAIVPQ